MDLLDSTKSQPSMDNIQENPTTGFSGRNAQPQRALRKAPWLQTTHGTDFYLRATPCGSTPQSAFERFLLDRQMAREKRRQPYDLTIIKNASPEELAQIEDFLVSRPVSDWRDVQALAALDSPRARALLRKTLKSRDHHLATAVKEHAPGLLSEEEQTRTLVAALKGYDTDFGTMEALHQVEHLHPPEIVDALFRGVLTRNGKTAIHFAAMLMFVRGKADSSFDWEQRPFFLKFNTEVRAEREAAFRELCEKLGVDGSCYLAATLGEPSTPRSQNSPK